MLIASLVMLWPALYNGYPLLYPDSMSYLQQGPLVARALFLRQFAPSYGGRSLIYSVGILPLHWNITPWPVVICDALVTAYILWLVVRSLLPRRTLAAYFVLVVALSLFTGLGWFVGWIMPDIFGPVLYHGVYLLVFAKETLSRAERVTVVLIAWWGVAAHLTHLVLAAGLCVLLVALLIVERQRTRRALRAVATVAMIVLLAAGAQVSLHAYLYGEPSLSGKRPPFVMARMIADGPGRWYLQRECPRQHVEVCAHVHDLPADVADFLWRSDGIWQSASPAQQERMRHEEMSVVVGTLRAYPREELRVSARHFWEQLHTFGLWGYGPRPWILTMVDTVLPGARARYLRSRQAQQTLPAEFFTSLQDWTVIGCVIVIACWAVFVRQWWSPRLIGLTVIIGFVVIANAAVTGVLSNVEDRYQARVIWLVPLLAGVFVWTWVDRRHRPRRLPPTEGQGGNAGLLPEGRLSG